MSEDPAAKRITVVFNPGEGERGREALEELLSHSLHQESEPPSSADETVHPGAQFFPGLESATVTLEAGKADQLAERLQGLEFVDHARQELTFTAAAERGPTNSWNTNPTREYLLGYRDGVEDLVRRLAPGEAENTPSKISIADSGSLGSLTPELGILGVHPGGPTGRGIRVAVLDTGIDFSHPELGRRPFTWVSFVPGAANAQDRSGHGTHSAGLIVGTGSAGFGTRYGVAPEVNLFIAQILDAGGHGSEQAVMRGIEWAVQNRCQVACLALASDGPYDQAVFDAYERWGAWALQNGCLLIAAAGNSSDRRYNLFRPVGLPAAVPTIFGVGALGQHGGMYFRSNQAGSVSGAEIDAVAPGESVLSSWSTSASFPGTGTPYWQDSGTSMATAFVTGIAALWAEQNPGINAVNLGREIKRRCRGLNLPAADAGFGLIQGPI